ncbi:MAG: hypothetical protein ACAI38_15180 [Myxococcota bacterium]
MAHAHEVNIHMKNSAMTVVDALTKAGAKVEGVEHPSTNAEGRGPPPGTALHRVTWAELSDSIVRSELRRLEQLGELEIQTQV